MLEAIGILNIPTHEFEKKAGLRIGIIHTTGASCDLGKEDLAKIVKAFGEDLRYIGYLFVAKQPFNSEKTVMIKLRIEVNNP